MQRTKKLSASAMFILVIILMLVVRDLMNVEINKYIFVAVIVGFAVFSSKTEIPVMLCFLFPLLWGLPYTWFIAPVTIIYLLKKRTIQIKAVILILFFFLAELVASMWYPEDGIVNIIKYLSVMAVFFVLLYDMEADQKKCINAFVAGLVVLCSVIVIKTLMTAPSNWLTLFVNGQYRFGMQQVEETSDITLKVNANNLAYYSIVGIAICMVGIDRFKKEYRVFAIILLLFFVLVGTLSLSRSWMLVTAICIILFLVGRAKSFKSVFQTVLIGLIACLAVIYAVRLVPELRDGFVQRWHSSDALDANGRVELFIQYHEIWVSNLKYILIGTGVTQYKQMTGVYHGLHNMLQQLFISYGLIGAPVFLYGMFSPVVKGLKNTSLILWIPMVAVLLFVQTIQFVYPEALMLPFVIALYILRMDDNEALYHHG